MHCWPEILKLHWASSLFLDSLTDLRDFGGQRLALLALDEKVHGPERSI